MKISEKQFDRIEKYFPKQRGNVKITNYDFINAILYIAENGCKWRAFPKEYGKWYSIKSFVSSVILLNVFFAGLKSLEKYALFMIKQIGCIWLLFNLLVLLFGLISVNGL